MNTLAFLIPTLILVAGVCCVFGIIVGVVMSIFIVIGYILLPESD